MRKRTKRAPSREVTATYAKNNFGDVLGHVAEGEAVYITKHDKKRAVVVSADRYDELTGPDLPGLEELEREFDEMFARMQTPESKAAVRALFDMESRPWQEADLDAEPPELD